MCAAQPDSELAASAAPSEVQMARLDATVKVVRPGRPSARRIEPPPASAATQIATPVAAASAAQANSLAPPPTTIVRYSVDAYQPDPAFDASLRAHARRLKADPNLHLLIKGHGDARGGVHYNRALAAKRAEVVAKVLLGYGVAARQLTQVIGDDDDPDSPDVRRVELVYR